ncbi:MAG: hypothetical protein D6773_09550, partial [Alphaproteobacteria bacterium]
MVNMQSQAMLTPSAPQLILASASASRAALLQAAGVPVTIRPADIDEAAVREALSADDAILPGDVAEILGRAKAETVSGGQPAALVIGADQVLECAGRLFEKPRSMAEARRTLL